MLVQPVFVRRQSLNRLGGDEVKGEKKVFFPPPKCRGNTGLPFVAPNPRCTKDGETSVL